jgi:hypothetical protein
MASASKTKEVGFAAAMTLLSLAFLVRAFFYPEDSSQFPRFLMMLQTAFSGLLLAGSLALPGTMKADPAHESGSRNRMNGLSVFKVPLQVFVAASVYLLAIGFIGYFVSTALFLALSMFWFGRHRPVVLVGVSLGFIAVVYALFVMFIGVRLPRGILI